MGVWGSGNYRTTTEKQSATMSECTCIPWAECGYFKATSPFYNYVLRPITKLGPTWLNRAWWTAIGKGLIYWHIFSRDKHHVYCHFVRFIDDNGLISRYWKNNQPFSTNQGHEKHCTLVKHNKIVSWLIGALAWWTHIINYIITARPHDIFITTGLSRCPYILK